MQFLTNNLGKPKSLMIIWIVLIFSYPSYVWSQNDGNPYIPLRLPDRVNLTVTEDPSTSAAVTWRTNTEVKEAFAEIVRADANPLSVNKAERFTAQTEILTTKDGRHKELTWKGVTAAYHSIVFHNLEPNTVYSYRVGSGAEWSEWFQFRTTSNQNDKFSFLYFGDAQTQHYCI